MRFRNAKTNRAKIPSDIRNVILLKLFRRDRVVIRQPLQAKHTDRVGFCFFKRRKISANRFTDVFLAVAYARIVRT